MNTDNEPSEETKNQWQNDPDNWIWGIFYYNPKDRRLFPPKKVKEFGWTTNFANPNSVFTLIMLIAVLIVIAWRSK